MSGAGGAFAVKLAKLNPAIIPIIGITRATGGFTKSVGYDLVLDYTSGTIVEEIARTLDREDLGWQSMFANL